MPHNNLKFDIYRNTAVLVFCGEDDRPIDVLVLRVATITKLAKLKEFLEDTAKVKWDDLDNPPEVADIFTDDKLKLNSRRLSKVGMCGLKTEWARICWLYSRELEVYADTKKEKRGFELYVKQTDPLTGRVCLRTHVGDVHPIYDTEWKTLDFLADATDVGGTTPGEALLDL